MVGEEREEVDEIVRLPADDGRIRMASSLGVVKDEVRLDKLDGVVTGLFGLAEDGAEERKRLGIDDEGQVARRRDFGVRRTIRERPM